MGKKTTTANATSAEQKSPRTSGSGAIYGSSKLETATALLMVRERAMATLSDRFDVMLKKHAADLMLEMLGPAPAPFAWKHEREAFIKEHTVDLKDFGNVDSAARKGGVLEYDTRDEELTDLGDRWALLKDKAGKQYVFHINPPSETLSLAAVGRRLNAGPTKAYLDYCGVGTGNHEGWKCERCEATPPDGANMLLMLAAAPL